MLKVTAASTDPRDVAADAVIVPVFKGGIEGPGASLLLPAAGLDDVPVTPQFRGDIGQHLVIATPGEPARALVLVGLGRMDETNADQLRRAAGVAARTTRDLRRVATTLAEVHPTTAAVEAVAEGFHLGAHEDRRFRSDPDAGAARLREVVVLVPSSRLWEARLAVERAALYAEATIAARELVNLPPDQKPPAALAEAVVTLTERCCDVLVHDDDALAAARFGGLLAVSRGSTHPPRLVELRYRPPNPLGHVVLVGKGITFDSGGLSLKRGDAMERMKGDMAGAAAVAAASSVLADLGVRLEVTGLLPLAENMPGGNAQRPGDVVTVRDGTTVEVRDTDAEGRLVLADALTLARDFEPDAIVDLATLTGASRTAVGTYAAVAVGNDDDLLDALLTAGEVAGEDLWPLPLWPRLEPLLDSSVADCVNTAGAGAGGGAIIAGLFLRRFVGDVPWVHVDMSGPALLSRDRAEGYLPAGGTGFGVRTLLAWLERRGE